MSDVAGVLLEQPNILVLSGILDYRSGPKLREDGLSLLQQVSLDEVIVDCSAVTRASSVGLSLLLTFMRKAAELNKSLAVRNLPEEMLQIAQVSGLQEILPLIDRNVA